MQFFLARARYSELSENFPGPRKFNEKQHSKTWKMEPSLLSKARSIKKTIPWPISIKPLHPATNASNNKRKKRSPKDGNNIIAGQTYAMKKKSRRET